MHPDLLRIAADGVGATPDGLDRIEDEAGVRLCGTRRGRQVEVRLLEHLAGALAAVARSPVDTRDVPPPFRSA
jgi:hypothetical protein